MGTTHGDSPTADAHIWGVSVGAGLLGDTEEERVLEQPVHGLHNRAITVALGTMCGNSKQDPREQVTASLTCGTGSTCLALTRCGCGRTPCPPVSAHVGAS